MTLSIHHPSRNSIITMTFLYIDNDDDESDEIYIYAICVHEKHLNSFLNILLLFSTFLYERIKRKEKEMFSQ